jgi:GxxExxY protein
MERNPLTEKVIGCAIEVHRTLGPGLLESTYLHALAHELDLRGIKFRMEHPLQVDYKDVSLDCGYRVDLLVDDRLIVELKSVEALKGIHTAQTLTYMKLSGIGTGLLINFNVERLVDGVKRLKI